MPRWCAAGRPLPPRAAAGRAIGRTLTVHADGNLFSRVARIFKSYANAAGEHRAARPVGPQHDRRPRLAPPAPACCHISVAHIGTRPLSQHLQ